MYWIKTEEGLHSVWLRTIICLLKRKQNRNHPLTRTVLVCNCFPQHSSMTNDPKYCSKLKACFRLDLKHSCCWSERSVWDCARVSEEWQVSDVNLDFCLRAPASAVKYLHLLLLFERCCVFGCAILSLPWWSTKRLKKKKKHEVVSEACRYLHKDGYITPLSPCFKPNLESDVRLDVVLTSPRRHGSYRSNQSALLSRATCRAATFITAAA